MLHHLIFSAVVSALMAALSPAVDYHVSPDGNDKWPGTVDRPWKSLPKAVERLSEIPGNVRLIVAEGTYRMDSPLSLKGWKGGSFVIEAAPGAAPVLSGERMLSGFKVLSDRTVLSLLDPSVKGRILVADLKRNGVDDPGLPFDRENLVDLYWKGERQRLARYPDEGFLKSGAALGETVIDGSGARKEGIFRYEDPRISGWKDERDAWIFGYFRWDWFDMYHKVASLDPETRTIELEGPWHSYGFKDGFRFYGINILRELDYPGEYYIDRDKGKVYWYPPAGYVPGDEVTVSVSRDPLMLEIVDCENVTVKGLTLSGGRRDALVVAGSKDILLEGLVITRFGGDAVHIDSSRDVRMESCLIETVGHSGIKANGGDRKTLESSGYIFNNLVVKDFSLFKHTYQPALIFKGCGVVVSHCEFSGSSSSAMRIEGNDALIEYNHFHDLVQESDDQGGIDMFYNYGYRGVVIRYNLWENILGGSLHGAAGVRFDDMISGETVYGNVFNNVGAVHFGAVQIHGGKDNLVENNVFYRCNIGVSFSPWGQDAWDKALEREDVVKKIHEEVEIDGPLYRGRYPELDGDIHGNVDRNIIRDNLAVGCRRMFYDEKGHNLLQNNHGISIGENPVTEPLDYYLSPEVLASFGLKPIPWEKIGPGR